MYELNHENQNSRTLQEYSSILKLKSKSTQKLFSSAINNVNAFGAIDIENISKYVEDDIYKLLQEWIIWNNKRGITAASITCYLNAFRPYLRYCKIRSDYTNIRQNLTFPRTLHENQLPLTSEMLKKILAVANQEFRFQLLALISSGMRVGELGQIRLSNLDLAHSNILVKIPANLTKTGRSRITFFSRQVSDMIRYRIKNKESIFTFCGNRTSEQCVNLILKRFSVARKKTGLIAKHDHCKQNRYTIHVHSIRSYFITRANKIQFGLGHILAGHGFYMKEYNQYTIDEMLDMYKKFEKDLIF